MSQLSLAVIARNKPLVRQLLAKNPDVDARDQYGYTPLGNAAILNDMELVQMLMAHHPEIDKEDIQGGTPLYWAIENGNVDMARLFLEAGALVNHYTAAGQPVGAYALMKDDAAMQSLLSQYKINWQFVEDYLTLKLLGHRFELSGRGHIFTPRETYMDVSYEGFDLEYTLKTICHSLFDYIASDAKKRLSDDFSEHMHLIGQALDLAAQLRVYHHRNIDPHDAAPLVKKLMAAPLWVVPVSFAGHAITFVKFKNYLARCDRGLQSGVEETVVIYEMKRPEQFTKEVLFYLMYDTVEEDFIKTEMPKLLGLQAVGSLPTRSQVAGNCSWANVEAAIPTALYMKLVDEVGTSKASSNMEKAALKYFQDWREWDRSGALNTLLTSYNTATQPRRAAMTEWMGEIFSQSLDPNVPLHIIRLQRMLPFLTSYIYNFVMKSYYPVYVRDAETEHGMKLRGLLLKAGFDFSFFD